MFTRECPSCHGETRELGTLGRITHYRCVDCGCEFGVRSIKEEDNVDEFFDRDGDLRGLPVDHVETEE